MNNYILEFTLLYGFCGICYLLINQKTQYRALRGFIVVSLLVSLIIPLVPAITSNNIQGFSLRLPEILISGGADSAVDTLQQRASNFSFISLLLSAFYVVSSLVCLRLLYSTIKLIQIIRGASLEKRDGVTLAFSKKVINPCSFFHYILLPEYYQFEEEELKVVLKHETFHVKFFHSIEKVAFEAANIFFWWHPVHYLFRKQQTLLHEYEVDQAMIQHVQPTHYKDILLQLIINPPGLRMTNPFSSNIKQRIKMMNKQKKKLNIPVLSSTLVLMVSGMLLIHACTSDDLLTKNLIEDKTITCLESKTYVTEVTDTLVTFDLETKKETLELVKSNMEVYKAPDMMPLFPGCDDSDEFKECSQQKLLQFVYKNITYPAEARANAVEGIVVVKFIVSKEGKILNQEIVRTPDDSLEEPVLEMIDLMQEDITWIPGKHNGKNVNVEFVLPVKFKLQ